MTSTNWDWNLRFLTPIKKLVQVPCCRLRDDLAEPAMLSIFKKERLVIKYPQNCSYYCSYCCQKIHGHPNAQKVSFLRKSRSKNTVTIYYWHLRLQLSKINVHTHFQKLLLFLKQAYRMKKYFFSAERVICSAKKLAEKILKFNSIYAFTGNRVTQYFTWKSNTLHAPKLSLDKLWCHRL